MKAAEQLFHVRLEQLRMVAFAARGQFFTHDDPSIQGLDSLVEQHYFDFVLTFDSLGAVLYRYPLSLNGGTSLTSENTKRVTNSRVDDFIIAAEEQGRTISGLTVLEEEEIRLLGYVDPPKRGMFMIAAPPPSGDNALVLGVMLNGSIEALSSPPVFLSLIDASIFLEDVRIASILGEHPDKQVRRYGVGFDGYRAFNPTTFRKRRLKAASTGVYKSDHERSRGHQRRWPHHRPNR